MRSLIPLSLLLTIFDSVHALAFPFDVSFGTPNPSHLSRRTPVPIQDIGNAQYVSNITVAGSTLPVLLDTGSSDLWVHFPSPPTGPMNDTGKSVTLSYAVGQATGNIQTTLVQISNMSVANQAFLFVNDTSRFTGSFSSQGYTGLLGLGPNQGSAIFKKVKGDAGSTLLQRIFEQDLTSSNYITILLNRISDPGEKITGQFTISEIVPGFENITSMAKLDVDEVNRLLKGDQHWQALTDKNIGIIGPDGQPIQVGSIVPNAPKGEYVAVFDSGFTFSQVPRSISDAIYGRVKGAYYDTTNQWWLVPCGQYLNISFNFGGQNYPVHPLDVVDNNFNKVDSTGKPICIGAFQPITTAFSLLGHYDMILGMSFLRNAYALLNFGDWIDNSKSQGNPYIQLLPTVDSNNALSDFIQVRLGGNNTISDPKWALLPANETQHSPISAQEEKEKYQEMILSRWPEIMVGCLAFVLLCIGCCVWRCCRRRRRSRGEAADKKSFFKKSARESYLPLEAKNHSVADLSGPYNPNVSTDVLRSSQHSFPHDGYGNRYQNQYQA